MTVLTFVYLSFPWSKLVFAISTANLRLSIGYRIQQSLLGIVLLKTYKICGSSYPNKLATSLM